MHIGLILKGTKRESLMFLIISLFSLEKDQRSRFLVDILGMMDDYEHVIFVSYSKHLQRTYAVCAVHQLPFEFSGEEGGCCCFACSFVTK